MSNRGTVIAATMYVLHPDGSYSEATPNAIYLAAFVSWKDQNARIAELEAELAQWKAGGSRGQIATWRDTAKVLRKLRNEVHGLGAFEFDVRQAIGNTNWQCLVERVVEADAALAKVDAP